MPLVASSISYRSSKMHLLHKANEAVQTQKDENRLYNATLPWQSPRSSQILCKRLEVVAPTANKARLVIADLVLDICAKRTSFDSTPSRKTYKRCNCIIHTTTQSRAHHTVTRQNTFDRLTNQILLIPLIAQESMPSH